MSIMDELKKLTRPYDDDTLMDDDLDLDLDEPSYARPTAGEPAAPAAEPVVNMGSTAPVSGGYNMGTSAPSNVTPINMGMGIGSVSAGSKYRVVLVKPEEFDAATAIAKHICQGDTVILNCEDTNEQVARRVIDFLSGCAFALDGSIKKASSSVIIIAPRDVGVDDARDGQLGG